MFPKRFNRAAFTLLCSVSLLLICVPAPTLAQRYTVQELGTLGGYNYGVGISANVKVGGYSYTAPGYGGVAHAFLWEDGEMIDLGTLGGANSYGNDVNSAGQVVGFSNNAQGRHRAFLWEDGEMTDLGTLGGLRSWGTAINEAGLVVGSAELPNGYRHAVIWHPDGPEDLGTFGGPWSEANAISENGDAAGWAEYLGGYRSAFLYTNDEMIDLGTLDGSSCAFGINEANQVTGYYASGGITRAFLWDDGEMIDLGDVPGWNHDIKAWDINNHGQIVGMPAFLWEDGAMQRLTDLLPEGHGWYLISATSINDEGYITGYGTNPDGVAQVAFLLTPIIEGDLNGDGCVDQADLGILLADWDCTGGGCAGDIDGDGDVDQADLGLLLANWGEGCL
ncbi:MAG TPA: hypothetical protein VM487_20715 [Phycisphaerae bacterium]|nr:hypothetical protein [Phycisphaerae bacterium]